MTPPSDAYGITDLAGRWETDKITAARATEREDFRAAVEVRRINVTQTSPGQVYVDKAEVHAWEESLRAAGQPLPGQRGRGQRGPDRQPRRRRGAAAEDQAEQ